MIPPNANKMGSSRIGMPGMLSGLGQARASADGTYVWIGPGITYTTEEPEVDPNDCSMYPDYAGTEEKIRSSMRAMSYPSCSVDPHASIPSGWRLPPIDSDAPDKCKKAYDSYELALSSDLPFAQDVAAYMCNRPSSGGTDTGTDTDTDTNGDSGSSEADPYGFYPYPDYNPVIAGREGYWNPEGGSLVVPNPFAPPAPAPVVVEEPSSFRKWGIGGGVLAVGVLAVLLVRRRRKKKRQSRYQGGALAYAQ